MGKISRAVLAKDVEAYLANDRNVARAAKARGIARTTLQGRLQSARREGLIDDISGQGTGGPAGLDPKTLRQVVEACDRADGNVVQAARDLGLAPSTVRHHLDRADLVGIKRQAQPRHDNAGPRILAAMRRDSLSLAEIMDMAACDEAKARGIVEGMRSMGLNVIELEGGRYSIERTMAPAFTQGELPAYVSRDDNTFLFGCTSDNHLGSKYERLDVLHDLYDRFARAGVDRVLNAGNWIDGVGRAGFNLHDLHTHGLDAQMTYLAENYPQREGITTYAVSGNDHEGWWAQREGIDVGKYAENKFRDAGREDWFDLGYMEAHIRLVNANTGASSILALVHPGGGTAYALSYSVQKIVEALEGGEKPAVWVGGHYHKLGAFNIRNVWVVMTGCTQDQTPFMRSKVKQEAHVGGVLVGLEQDPETGAIVSMTPTLIRYFNQGFYNRRWSMSGPVVLPERAA